MTCMNMELFYRRLKRPFNVAQMNNSVVRHTLRHKFDLLFSRFISLIWWFIDSMLRRCWAILCHRLIVDLSSVLQERKVLTRISLVTIKSSLIIRWSSVFENWTAYNSDSTLPRLLPSLIRDFVSPRIMNFVFALRRVFFTMRKVKNGNLMD